jgi:hypothetical protein
MTPSEDADLQMKMTMNIRKLPSNLFSFPFLNFIQDITVSVKIPDNAKTVEDTVDGEEIVRISAEDFIAMADGQQAVFTLSVTFILALLL